MVTWFKFLNSNPEIVKDAFVGLGVRVQGLGFRFQVWGCRVWGLGCRFGVLFWVRQTGGLHLELLKPPKICKITALNP